MRLLKLEAENICQHENTTLDFEFGITGITGPNGTGKSNLIDTILYFALTGKIVGDVTKEELIRWGSPTGQTVITFEHAGHEYSLTRKLHTAYVGLDDLGDRTWKLRGAEANKFMASALGSDFDVFYEACWTPQGDLTKILDMTHAKRVAFFQRLTDVHRAEKLREILMEYGLSKVPEIPDPTENILAAETELRDLKLALLQSETAEKKADEDSRKAGAAAAEYAHVLSLRSKEEVDQEIQNWKSTADAVAAGIVKAKKDLEGLGPVQEVRLLTAAEHASLRVDLDALDRNAQSLLEKRSRLDALSAQVKAMSAPDESWMTIAQEIPAKQAEISRLSKEYEFLLGGKCPTCDRPLDTSPEDLQRRYDVITAGLAEIQEKQDQVKKAKEAFTAERKRQDDARALLNRAGADLKVIENRVTSDLEALGDFSRDELLEIERNVSVISARNKKIQELTLDITRRESSLAIKLRDIENLEKTPTAYAHEKASARALQDASTTKANAYREASMKVARLRSDVLHKENFIRTLEAQRESRKKSAAKRAVLQKAYDVLHREKLPRLVMTSILYALNTQMSAYLGEFDTTFSARIDDNFDVLVTFPDKEDISASVLSGGQSVALCLAFKFAVASLFSSAMPLMVMDEPTVYLDSNNVKRVGALLEKVRDIASKGTYVLVATHEESLISAMDRCVDLGARS